MYMSLLAQGLPVGSVPKGQVVVVTMMRMGSAEAEWGRVCVDGGCRIGVKSQM